MWYHQENGVLLLVSKNLVKTAWDMALSIAYCTCEIDAFPCITHEHPAWQVWLEACCTKPGLARTRNRIDLERGYDPLVGIALATAGMPCIIQAFLGVTRLYWSGIKEGANEGNRVAGVGLSHRSSEVGWRIQLKKAQITSLVATYAEDCSFVLPASFLAEVGLGSKPRKCMDESSLPKQATRPAKPRSKQKTRKKRNNRPATSSRRSSAQSDRQAAKQLLARR